MSIEDRYAPPKSAVEDVVHSKEAPALWNPNAAASWSLVFSPIFGSLLHMFNWRAMGEPAKAAASRNWVYGSIAYFAAFLVLGIVFSSSKLVDVLGRVGGLALLIAWYYVIGKSQATEVAARYGAGYPRLGWVKPLLLGVAAIVGIFVLAVLIGVSMAIVGR